jgi:hypothetical protein
LNLGFVLIFLNIYLLYLIESILKFINFFPISFIILSCNKGEDIDSGSRQYIIYRAYSFEEKDNKVVSVKLNAPLEGVDTHIAMITAIEVEETHGVIDIDFTIDIFVDLNHFFYTPQLRNLIGMPFFYLYLDK